MVLSAYKVRTAIAVIGVLLGAFALVTVQNVSSSMQKKVENDIKEFGDRVITIFARHPQVPGQMPRRTRITSMKIRDSQSVLTVANTLKAAPAAYGTFSTKYGNAATTAVVIGTTEPYFDMRGLKLTDGRLFIESEHREKERVAILGSETAKALFDGREPLGERILINSMSFEVIGVLAEKGSDLNGNSMDGIIVIPVETILSRLLNRDYLSYTLVQLKSWADFPVASEDIARILRINHNLPTEAADDFRIINPIDEQEMSNTLIGLATTLGSASAGIAFFIGAIGIFSLMLLIVNQRITEIGIKRAIGATKHDILLQFVMESAYIGVVGGMTGVFIGCLVSLVVSHFASLPYSLSLTGAVLSFIAAILSGTLAGLYPALKASRIEPVEALRL